ncbi:MAG: SDR family oxidoreductase [Flavobacteriales bacterium]|nr:SDR family oxidoreductase [Flavobacteriales bacterium]
MTLLKYKNVLITGGAGGIGRLVAEEMAASGATVILWDLNEKRLKEAAKLIEDQGGRVFTHVCDVTDRKAVYATMDQVKRDCGNIDILINNAGVVTGKAFWDLTDEDIQTTMDVNVMAMFWTVKAVLPDMIEANTGHIVTISSAAGIVGATKLTDYNASKFAAFGFDESLRMEFKKNKMNIRTTVVCPYFINTGMFKGVKTRFSWLLPILEEKEVANRIVKAIKSNRTRLIMPGLVYTSWMMRYLPVSVFDWVSAFLGVSSAMDQFEGREKAKSAS